MPMTDDFRKILRNEKRRGENELVFEVAINKAFEKGIKPFRERKKPRRFRRQDSDLFNI